MKLLQVLYPGLGGHSSVAFSLIEGDKDQKYKHSLLGFGIEKPSESFLDKAKELNVESNSVLKSKGLDLVSQKRVYQIIRKLRPDVIIIHSTSLVFIIWWYSLFNKVKLVSVEHQSNQAKSWKDWINSFFILLLISKVVYLTDIYKTEMETKFGFLVSKSKAKVINNGVNTKTYFNRNVKVDKKGIVFAMISRLTPLRDHGTLIQAFGEFVKYESAVLYIAGDGTTMEEYKDLTNSLGLENYVRFLGSINESQIIELLNQTDIYIHSSLYETLSTSLLQVMACNVPIIATDIPGIQNLFDDGIDALLFQPGSKEELIAKMNNLSYDISLRNILKENAHRKIKTLYDCERMFENYNDLLK